MRRVVLTTLAAVGVAAGLAVTASSTTHVAFEAGMRGLALAAIVVVLEVTNVLGTWVLLTDERTHACVEAGVFVALASLVTGWCGLLTYGLIGLVGPVFVLGGVELARLASSTPRGSAESRRTKTPQASAPAAPKRRAPARQPAMAPVQTEPEWWGPPPAPAPTLWEPTPDETREPAPDPDSATAPIELDALGADQGADPPPADPEAEGADEQGAEPAPPPSGADDDEVLGWIADQARERGRPPGRDAIRTRWGMGAKRAERLLKEHKATPRLTAVKGN